LAGWRYSAGVNAKLLFEVRNPPALAIKLELPDGIFGFELFEPGQYAPGLGEFSSR
jgi:hypothetical protein